MSSYSIKIILSVLLVTLFSGCAINSLNSQQSYKGKNDTLILMALDSQSANDYNKSFYYYNTLYNNTNDIQFLKEAIFYSYKIPNFQMMEKLSQDGIKKFHTQKQYFKIQYIIALIAQEKFDIALKEAKEILKNNPSEKNYSLVASIYYAMKNYKESVKYYESAYAQKQNEKTLITLSDILYNYLNKKDTALAYLETYLQNKGCGNFVCKKLMLIYQEQGNIDGMLTILTKLYNKYKSSPTLHSNTKLISDLISSLLSKQNINKAIKYLEKTKINNSMLINLYYQDNQLEKALLFTKKLYNKTHNPELLGRIAMFRFELAKDKKKVLKNVIANFELALSSGINIPQYQNYYGYLLIDYNLDINKGVRLIEQAVKSAPNNIAYMDSLAWGYYKLNKCNKAYKLMKQVVNLVGLNDKDIKSHWDKINKCKRIKK